MDWSSVFEDVGEEEGDWIRHEDISIRTGMLQLLRSEGSYGPFICYAFTVNYILGVGCLGIPYAFLKCGIFLGIFLVIVLSFVSYITVIWVAVATQQEIMLSSYLSSSNPFVLSPHTSFMKRRNLEKVKLSSTENTSLKNNQESIGSFYSSISQLIQTNDGSNSEELTEKGIDLIRRKKLEHSKKRADDDAHAEMEVTDLAHELLGSYGKIIYQSSLMLLTYVGLLAYTQVFNNSFVSQVWPNAPVYLPPLLFGVMVVPLSCFDLAEQVTVQVAMSLLRFLSLAVLLIGTLVACWVDPEGGNITGSRLEHGGSEGPPLVNFYGFGMMFTTAIFSQLFQHSVPGLIRPLSAEHKKFVPQVFKYALLTTAVVYIAIGTVCVMYFGDSLKQSVNLNFVGFTWGVKGGALSLLVTVVAMLVVLFPALDTVSVFPLIANTLGNNLNSAFPGLNGVLKRSGWVTERQTVRKLTLIVWRIVAALPPIVASVFVSDLILSLQLAGLCGIVVALVTPALLKRQTEFRQSLVPPSVQASSPFAACDTFSHPMYPPAVLLLAAVAIVISFCQMVT